MKTKCCEKCKDSPEGNASCPCHHPENVSDEQLESLAESIATMSKSIQASSMGLYPENVSTGEKGSAMCSHCGNHPCTNFQPNPTGEKEDVLCCVTVRYASDTHTHTPPETTDWDDRLEDQFADIEGREPLVYKQLKDFIRGEITKARKDGIRETLDAVKAHWGSAERLVAWYDEQRRIYGGEIVTPS